MKSLFYFTASILTLCAVSCQPSLHISGTSPSNSPVTISHSVYDELQVIATIKPKAGKFSYKIKTIDTTEVYLLQTDLKNTIGHFFIGEKGHINIAIDTTGNVRVTGTEYNDFRVIMINEIHYLQHFMSSISLIKRSAGMRRKHLQQS